LNKWHSDFGSAFSVPIEGLFCQAEPRFSFCITLSESQENKKTFQENQQKVTAVAHRSASPRSRACPTSHRLGFPSLLRLVLRWAVLSEEPQDFERLESPVSL
jgi:hypothetical protein